MPTASVTSPMIPPSASISRTRCPLAIPPTAGLHDICAIRSTFSVYSAVFSPMRAAAIAASCPACPAPTTTTSNCSSNFIGSKRLPPIHADERGSFNSINVFSVPLCLCGGSFFSALLTSPHAQARPGRRARAGGAPRGLRKHAGEAPSGTSAGPLHAGPDRHDGVGLLRRPAALLRRRRDHRRHRHSRRAPGRNRHRPARPRRSGLRTNGRQVLRLPRPRLGRAPRNRTRHRLPRRRQRRPLPQARERENLYRGFTRITHILKNDFFTVMLSEGLSGERGP